MAKEPKETKENSVQDGKSEALKLAIAQITKQFGDGSIMKLGENHNVNIELIHSGSLSLDLALGGGSLGGHCALDRDLLPGGPQPGVRSAPLRPG